MKAIIFLFSLMFGSGAVSDNSNRQQLEFQVGELLEVSMQLFQDKDLEGLVERFHPEGSLKLPGHPLVRGHLAIRDFYKGTLTLEDFDLKLDLQHVDVASQGDMAWAMAGLEVSFITPEGPFFDEGISLLVLKRVGDQWKIMAENLSSGKGAQ